MKIKLAILEKDANYLSRIVTVFSTKYADKFQVYSFTDPNIALSALQPERIDVLLANDGFEIDPDSIPKRCSFAYFVDSADVDTVNDCAAICKFQKAELIYKQILSIYSETAASIGGVSLSDGTCKVITFSSPVGGTGTSSVAAACALYHAQRGKKVMFLSFDNFGASDIFFSGEGQFDMSDVIFAIKSRKPNLAMKLESYVKQDSRGVFFYSKTKYALDMLELKHAEKMQLLNELQILGSYDYIIIDADFAYDKDHFELYRKSNAIVMVSDGSEIANLKTDRAYSALITIDQNAEVPVANRFMLIYNKYSSKGANPVENEDIKIIGGAPVYAHATVAQIIAQLATLPVFDKID